MRATALQLSALAVIATAQQFAGDFIPNSLPAQTGANISFFNVHDALGGRTTLINYYSTPNGKVQDQKKVQRAIIVLSGAGRNGGDYFTNIRNQIPAAAAINPQVSEETVAIMAPVFANELDGNKAYPVTGGVSTSNALVWPGLDWVSGSTNIYPAKQKTVSTYEALDQAIQWFSNPFNFPNLKQIVVAGHSAGGQMAQHYAVVGAPLDLTVPITYWVGNPNSFAWLNSTRPESTDSCPTYDHWSGGLAGYGSGNYTYNALLGAPIANPVLIRANYALKHVAYARGLLDHGNFSQADCSAVPQGDNRGTRFINFLTYFKPTKLDTVDYIPNAGHSNPQMFGSLAGLTRLFLDNWDGSGRRAPDFGPRQVPGDDPHPVSAGNWTSI